VLALRPPALLLVLVLLLLLLLQGPRALLPLAPCVQQ
jgi:hypothetical protein